MPELATLVEPAQVIDPSLASCDSQQERLAAIHGALADSVADAVNRGDRPVSIAGDCCTTIGVAAGLQRSGISTTLIWFDAHGDFNTCETTPSGFVGGMPLAMLVGLGNQSMLNAVGLQPILAEQVILTDGRDLDPGERELVKGSGILHLPDMGMLLGAEPPDGPLWIHFDTDILDPVEAPAMNYPASGGPRVKQLEAVFRRLAGTGRVAAVSMSTWNPQLDEDGRTETTCMALLQTLLG
ncbi:MAG: arginase family protein [Chloroflexota bacterium]|nr:arginase family protein [Chloroflexota bacterium]